MSMQTITAEKCLATTRAGPPSADATSSTTPPLGNPKCAAFSIRFAVAISRPGCRCVPAERNVQAVHGSS
jgi:hypothetical protein